VTGEEKLRRAIRGIRGYVLAGGASSRFGSDKALARLGEETVLSRICTLIENVTGRLSVVAATNRYFDLGYSIVPDRWPGEGPLGGIITALRATAETNGGEWNLIVSCDMPFLTREWLSYLVERALATDVEVIVARSKHGLEPLCACWRTAAAAKLRDAFDGGVRKVTEAMKPLRMEVLDETQWKRFDTAGKLFWNMNTPQDYEEAARIWRMERE
jgi:molybdopterin-guanine dinucleotide biosynthesis protein A